MDTASPRRRRAHASARSRDDQVARRISADASLIAAGGRAILLQIADPVVAAGVAKHSDFARRPQQRLVRTLTYVYAVVLGDARARDAAAMFVRRAHRPVTGASDPARQRWVAATLYDSAVRMHELLCGPMPPALRQALLLAYEPLGGALEVPEAMWPRAQADFDALWKRSLAELVVAEDARAVARYLFFPRLAPWPIRAAMPAVRVITVGLLPEEVRDAYGFAWGAGERRRFDRIVGVLRAMRRLTPGPVRRLPARLLLRRLVAGSARPRTTS